jgi:hypothetical protein
MARDASRLRVNGDRSTLGIDIVQEKRDAREAAKATEIKVALPILEECAGPSSLKRYAYATIGKLTIPEIRPSHIYELPIRFGRQRTSSRSPRSSEGKGFIGAELST